MREYRKSNRGAVATTETIWKHRGIVGATEETYQFLLKRQGGMCLCGRTVNDDGRRLGLDHDHATGLPRAVLCQKCNRMFGKLDKFMKEADIPSGLEAFTYFNNQLRKN